MDHEANANSDGGKIDVAAAIAEAADEIARAGVEGARLDAELLMAAAAGVARAAIVAGAAGAARPDGGAMRRFRTMVARRARREPLAYIVERREFYSLNFAVRPGVLVPRPETESVVDAALDFLRVRPVSRVLEIGTGSGAIAIAVAVHAPRVRIAASDISKVALQVSSGNARRHRVADRVEFVEGDCYAALDASLAPFDLILSNPPYIEDAALATLTPEVRDFEPRAALAGGPDGMDFYRRIAAGLERWLMPDGEAIFEVGAGQADTVEAIMRAAGYEAGRRIRDLAGLERVVRLRRAW